MKKLFLAAILISTLLTGCIFSFENDPAKITCYSGDKIIYDEEVYNVSFLSKGKVVFRETETSKPKAIMGTCVVELIYVVEK